MYIIFRQKIWMIKIWWKILKFGENDRVLGAGDEGAVVVGGGETVDVGAVGCEGGCGLVGWHVLVGLGEKKECWE